MRRQLMDMKPITIRVYNATFPPPLRCTRRGVSPRCVALHLRSVQEDLFPDICCRKDTSGGFRLYILFKGPKILPSQQLGAAVAPWPGATGLIASVTADDMAHKECFMFPKISFRRGLNIAAAESTSEEAIGESAGCSKIHELSDRVRLSGVCSVKLALAHRIAASPPPRRIFADNFCRIAKPLDGISGVEYLRDIVFFHRKIHSAALRDKEALRLPKKSGSLANRSVSVLPREFDCRHDISPTTNQPPSCRSCFYAKRQKEGEKEKEVEEEEEEEEEGSSEALIVSEFRVDGNPRAVLHPPAFLPQSLNIRTRLSYVTAAKEEEQKYENARKTGQAIREKEGKRERERNRGAD
ncbi:hypothetical protein DBV15_08300 [Temnothorax longispinosus]|uniref:Uncharacterized protein n=1 Tax=Temnothorax longispinosus TaxID=300112 RepID=A0A4S2KHB8_9HYME|nr:hypothetical protein DBV15_08300 [Temnothorax longispinosus]